MGSIASIIRGSSHSERHAETNPHRGGEIVRTDEAGVDTGDAQDLVRRLDALDVLDLDHDEQLVVGMLR